MGKKFLIITASVGSGHEKAAGAIAEGVRKSFPHARLDIVDFMSWHTSAVNALMKGCYLKMLVHMMYFMRAWRTLTGFSMKHESISIGIKFSMARK